MIENIKKLMLIDFINLNGCNGPCKRNFQCDLHSIARRNSPSEDRTSSVCSKGECNTRRGFEFWWMSVCSQTVSPARQTKVVRKWFQLRMIEYDLLKLLKGMRRNSRQIIGAINNCEPSNCAGYQKIHLLSRRKKYKYFYINLNTSTYK